MGILKDLILGIAPAKLRLPLWYCVKKMSGSLDYEIEYLKQRVPRDSIMIDIGANIGIYSFAFALHCQSVVAFEPQSSCNKILQAYGSPKIKVLPVALSRKAGTMKLHIPVRKGSVLTGLASLREIEGKTITEEVELAVLDHYNFKNIGFLKIDVEGHEKDVLEGGIATIRREHPIILIEIEQRHTATPVNEIFEIIQKEGYRGGFLLNKEYHPLTDFSYEKHQAPFTAELHSESYSKIKGQYVCNFIFEPIR